MHDRCGVDSLVANPARHQPPPSDVGALPDATTARRLPVMHRRLRTAFVVTAALVTLVSATAVAVSTAGAAHTRPTHGVAARRPAGVVPAPAGLIAITAPHNDALWVLAGTPSVKALTEIDSKTGAVVASIGVSPSATDLVWLPNGYLALSLATRLTGALVVYNPQTSAIAAQRPLAGPATALAVAPNGSQLYALVKRPGAKSVAVVSGLTMRLLGTVPVDLRAISVAAIGGNGSMLVLDANGEVEQVSLGSFHVLTEFRTGIGARNMVVSPDGRWLYVVRFLSHISKLPGVGSNVARVSLATEQVVRVLPAPAHCVALAIAADGKVLYDGVGTLRYGNVQAYLVAS
jgi:hypothetical protein